MKRLSLGSFRGLGLRPRPQKEPRPQSFQSRYLRKILKLHLEKFSKHFDRTIREGKDHFFIFSFQTHHKLNQDHLDIPHVLFDYHQEVKSGNVKNLGKLKSKVQKYVERFGFFTKKGKANIH